MIAFRRSSRLALVVALALVPCLPPSPARAQDESLPAPPAPTTHITTPAATGSTPTTTPPPGTPASASPADQLLSQLQGELRVEAATRAVNALVDRVTKRSPEKGALLDALRPSAEFVLANPTLGLEELLARNYAAPLAAGSIATDDLKVPLETFRAFAAYKIKPIDPKLVPATKTGFSPRRARGYPAEVDAISREGAHSMSDLGTYLADRFTASALDRMVHDGHVVEVHTGTLREAMADLTNRGWRVAGEVASPKGNYERLLVAEGPDGEVRYVVTGDVTGKDRVRHLAALLRLAGEGRQGVAPERVELVGDPEVASRVALEGLRDGLTLAGKGKSAIVGFRETIKKELSSRAVSRAQAEEVRAQLGDDPVATLRERVTAERDAATGAEREALDRALETLAGKKVAGLGREPAAVLGKSREHEAFLEAEKLVVAAAAEAPGSATLSHLVKDGYLSLADGQAADETLAARTVESGPLRADELTVETDRGPESLLLVNNYYGDALAPVVRSLLESGRTDLAYFGTAGGVGKGVRVGDIQVPETILGTDQSVASEGVRNGFLDLLAGEPWGRLKLGTKLGTVFSPAVETMGWLEEMRAAGVDAVEVENAYVTREIASWNAEHATDAARFFSAVTISDVPGSHETLGANAGAVVDTFERMIDHFLAALGIKGISLRQPKGRLDRPEVATDRERLAQRVADKLLPRAKDPQKLLRDALARTLATVDPETLESLRRERKPDVATFSGLDESVRASLLQELSAPYTDKQALESVDRANAVLSRFTAEMRARHPRARFEIALGNGVEDGRFSPDSPITVEVRGHYRVRKSAEDALAKARAEVAGAPDFELVTKTRMSADPIVFADRGQAFVDEPAPLERAFTSRLLRRGVTISGKTVGYVRPENTRVASDATQSHALPLAAEDLVEPPAEVGMAPPVVPVKDTKSTSVVARPTVESLASLTVPELLLRAHAQGLEPATLTKDALIVALTGSSPADVSAQLEAHPVTIAPVGPREGITRLLERETTADRGEEGR